MKINKKSKVIAITLLSMLILGFVFHIYRFEVFKIIFKNSEATGQAYKILNVYFNDFYPQLIQELPHIDVVYINMKNGIEGYFAPSTFNNKKNTIFINSHFQGDPPILNAMVILHEATHVLQLKNETELDCIEREVQAYLNQAYLYFLVDDQNRNIVSTAALKYQDPVSESVLSIAIIFDSKVKECGQENWQCWSQSLKEDVTEMVLESEAYQKQCQLN